MSDITAMLEIGDLIERAPYQLSAGQKKRVAIDSVLAMMSPPPAAGAAHEKGERKP